MTWIDEALEQRQEMTRRNSAIASAAERTYAILWKEITDRVSEAAIKGIQVLTNGSPHERIVVLPGNPRNELHVTLKKDEQVISITGIESPFDLAFDLSIHNVVGLTRDGVEIDMESAAKAILYPFLFPELIATQSQSKVRQFSSTLRDGTY